MFANNLEKTAMLVGKLEAYAERLYSVFFEQAVLCLDTPSGRAQKNRIDGEMKDIAETLKNVKALREQVDNVR